MVNAFIVLCIICTVLVVVFPAILKSINLPLYEIESIVPWLRWPVMALIVMAVRAITYKIARSAAISAMQSLDLDPFIKEEESDINSDK